MHSRYASDTFRVCRSTCDSCVTPLPWRNIGVLCAPDRRSTYLSPYYREASSRSNKWGTRMFERTAIGVFPTDAGRIFLEHAREVVARADDLGREMDLMKGLDKGELHIGSGTYPSAMMVDRAVARMVQLHPAVRLRIVTDNWASLLPRLRKREMDFAIMDVTEIGEDPQLDIVRLNQHQGHRAARSGHPLLARNRKRS